MLESVVTPPVIAVPFAKNVTVPVGLPLALVPTTVAVSIEGLPATTVEGVATTAVVEATVVTVSGTVAEAVAAMVAPVVVPLAESVSVAVPLLWSTGVTVMVT